MPNETADNRESVAHMVSEFFRELAALILVFVPLDYLLKGDRLGANFWPETPGSRSFLVSSLCSEYL
jgi:hypothetical protein